MQKWSVITRTLIFLVQSISLSDRWHNNESISSMKTTAGWWHFATANSARTIFSPSPTHFEVKHDALILKNVDSDCDAMHFPINVLPVPGGPKSRMPRGGRLKPVKMSGRSIGYTTASFIIFFAYSNPAMSSQATNTQTEIYEQFMNRSRI